MRTSDKPRKAPSPEGGSTGRRALVAAAVVAAVGVAGIYAYGSSSNRDQTLSLSGVYPVDVRGASNGGDRALGERSEYDVFSWLNFIALNSPVDGGVLGASGDNRTLWSTWMEDFQVLVSDGQTPAPWGTPLTPPQACTTLNAGDGITRTFAHTSKMDGVVGLFDQAQAGPLIDQNGSYVRYEIAINEPMYNYIRDNRLYTQKGLDAFGQIDFPSSSLETGEIGAIMIKAAWKVLGTGDDPSRFHVSRAYVLNQQANTCAVEALGLVGFHISAKTESAPQWIWSTFEHADNAPDAGAATASAHYSFFDPDCATLRPRSDCAPNALPPTPWNPALPNQIPVQVERVTPIDAATAAINKKFQGLLQEVNASSVWANYMLVGTQYPQSPNDPTDPQGRPFPQFLANSTIETFLQGSVPPVSSSCIACHNRATTTAGAKPADFTYILSRVTAKE